MNRSKLPILAGAILLGLALAFSACGPGTPIAPVETATPIETQAPTTPAPSEAPAPTEAPPVVAGAAEAPAAEIALKVTGSVASEQAWTEAEVKAMKTLDVESTNNKGEKETYTGVLLTDLLAAAQPSASATTVVFVADNGYTAEIGLEELNACADCIVSFRSKGGFSTVLPGFPGGLQVKGVVEIQVK
jgi:hypothetical protein